MIPEVPSNLGFEILRLCDKEERWENLQAALKCPGKVMSQTLLDVIPRAVPEEQRCGKSQVGSPQGQRCQAGLRPSGIAPGRGTEQRGEAL